MQPEINQNQIHNNWDHLRNVGDEVTPPENYGQEEKPKKSIFFWFFLGGLVLLLIACIFAFYQYYSKSNTVSNEKIDLSLNIDENVKGGQQGKMAISILNNNKVTLSNARLTIKSQKGLSRDGVIDQDIKIYELGDILQNIYTATDTEYIFNGQEGDKRKVQMTLEYNVIGQNSTFKKELIKEVKIISPSITVNISALSEVIEDHDYLLKIKVKNVAYTSAVSLALKMEVPPGFIVRKESGINPLFVEIKNLKIGETNDYNVSGFFKTTITNSKTFVATVSTYENGDTRSLISESSKEVALVGSPISFDYKLKSDNSDVKYFDMNKENLVDLNINNISSNYISDIVLIADTGIRKYTFNKSNTEYLDKINPSESKKIEIPLLKDVIAPVTKIRFEVFGKIRGGDSSILLKSFNVEIETR